MNFIYRLLFIFFSLTVLLIQVSSWGEAKPNGNNPQIGLVPKNQFMDLELFRSLAQKVNPAVVNIQSLQKKIFLWGFSF